MGSRQELFFEGSDAAGVGVARRLISAQQDREVLNLRFERGFAALAVA